MRGSQSDHARGTFQDTLGMADLTPSRGTSRENTPVAHGPGRWYLLAEALPYAGAYWRLRLCWSQRACGILPSRRVWSCAGLMMTLTCARRRV